MFIPAIKGQATKAQQEKWLPLANRQAIIGCYAQTELGHGSNVQGLETTATFDPATDEFIVHSPTLTATKVRHFMFLGCSRHGSDYLPPCLSNIIFVFTKNNQSFKKEICEHMVL